jgi:hypothetical protein
MSLLNWFNERWWKVEQSPIANTSTKQHVLFSAKPPPNSTFFSVRNLHDLATAIADCEISTI